MSLIDESCFNVADRCLREPIAKFVLGFSALAFVPAHCAAACVKFLKDCFLFHPRSMQSLPEEYGSRASLARIRAFAASDVVNAHTGTVLLENIGDRVQITEFRMGLPSVAPYGMEFPKCPTCGAASLTSSKQRNGILLKCHNPREHPLSGRDMGATPAVDRAALCPFKTAVKKPDFVTELDIPELGQHHYILDFLLSSGHGVLGKEETEITS